MGDYRIFETDRFQKSLAEIARSGQQKVSTKLREVVYPELRRQPYVGANIRKLRDWEPPTWRYRIGSWRFFYEIDDERKRVVMVAAAHRGSAY